MFTIFYSFFVALLIHALTIARILLAMLTKIAWLCVDKELADVPAEMAAELLRQLGKRTANFLGLQRRVACKRASTIIMLKSHNTLWQLCEFNRELVYEHTQDLKMELIALMEDRDQLLADNECLQAELGAYAK